MNSSDASRLLHVALIMDGNGRWASARGMPRVAGHRRGAEGVRRIVETAPELGIGTITLYAFSADNWQRPAREVAMLMRLFERYLRSEAPKLAENGVRLAVIGRRDRLALPVRAAIEAAEEETAGGERLLLRVAIDYSARDAIVRAAQRLALEDGEPTRESFAAMLADEHDMELPASEVDLLIRTGGERRLSDFLLWESAYAELYFSEQMWPEFGPTDLADAVEYFHSRQRRFGALPAAG